MHIKILHCKYICLTFFFVKIDMFEIFKKKGDLFKTFQIDIGIYELWIYDIFFQYHIEAKAGILILTILSVIK